MKIAEPKLHKYLAPLNISSLDGEQDTVNGSLVDTQIITASLPHFSIIGSRIVKSDFTRSNFEGLSLDNVAIESCTILTGRFTNSSWHTTKIINSRCSGIQLDMSTLKNVVFIGCKLDLANFRYAKMTNVIFEECVIDDMDLYGSILKNIDFIDCKINNLELQNSKLKNVDFRKSEFVRIKISTDLKGAIISTQQLIFLSPQLAHHAGIVVED